MNYHLLISISVLFLSCSALLWIIDPISLGKKLPLWRSKFNGRIGDFKDKSHKRYYQEEAHDKYGYANYYTRR